MSETGIEGVEKCDCVLMTKKESIFILSLLGLLFFLSVGLFVFVVCFVKEVIV